MQESGLASHRDGWLASKQAAKKSGLPSGGSAGQLT